MSVSKQRHVCVCTVLAQVLCSSHHMAPPTIPSCLIIYLQSKKHKVPPDHAGPSALLNSDCTARLQSNLSDDVVMGSPPHPWAPDSDG